MQESGYDNDAQLCADLTHRFGESLALDIYTLFDDKDGTAPIQFKQYAQAFGKKYTLLSTPPPVTGGESFGGLNNEPVAA